MSDFVQPCEREGCSFIALNDGLCRWCYGALRRPVARENLREMVGDALFADGFDAAIIDGPELLESES